MMVEVDPAVVNDITFEPPAFQGFGSTADIKDTLAPPVNFPEGFIPALQVKNETSRTGDEPRSSPVDPHHSQVSSFPCRAGPILPTGKHYPRCQDIALSDHGGDW